MKHHENVQPPTMNYTISHYFYFSDREEDFAHIPYKEDIYVNV